MSCGFPYCGGVDCADCHKDRHSDAELEYPSGPRPTLSEEGMRHLLEASLGRPLTDAECWKYGLPDSEDRALAPNAPKCRCGGWSPREIICRQCGRAIPRSGK
jgi:hypothetical protein